MNKEAIFNALEAIRKDISEIKESISHLPQRRLPLPPGFNPMGKRKFFSRRLYGGLKSPEIRSFILQLRREGQLYKDIAASVKERWPGQPEKHPSKSAIHRFCMDVRNGRLREFGIEGDL